MQSDFSSPQRGQFKASTLRSVNVTIGFMNNVNLISREIHGVICYLIWKVKSPVEVYNEVKTAYDDKAMNRTSVLKWCGDFKNSRTSVHDDQRSKDLQL